MADGSRSVQEDRSSEGSGLGGRKLLRESSLWLTFSSLQTCPPWRTEISVLFCAYSPCSESLKHQGWKAAWRTRGSAALAVCAGPGEPGKANTCRGQAPLPSRYPVSVLEALWASEIKMAVPQYMGSPCPGQEGRGGEELGPTVRPSKASAPRPQC